MLRYLSFILLVFFGLSSGCVMAQGAVKRIGDFIESTSYNDHKRGAARSLQYRPEGDDFVCVNGKNRYSRALYGSSSAFRKQVTVLCLLPMISEIVKTSVSDFLYLLITQ